MVENVEVRDVKLPQSMQRAVASDETERARRAKVISTR